MRKAISATGLAKTNSLDQWVAITIHFDDGSTRFLPDVTASLRQILHLARQPENYAQILGVLDG